MQKLGRSDYPEQKFYCGWPYRLVCVWCVLLPIEHPPTTKFLARPQVVKSQALAHAHTPHHRLKTTVSSSRHKQLTNVVHYHSLAFRWEGLPCRRRENDDPHIIQLEYSDFTQASYDQQYSCSHAILPATASNAEATAHHRRAK